MGEKAATPHCRSGDTISKVIDIYRATLTHNVAYESGLHLISINLKRAPWRLRALADPAGRDGDSKRLLTVDLTLRGG